MAVRNVNQSGGTSQTDNLQQQQRTEENNKSAAPAGAAAHPAVTAQDRARLSGNLLRSRASVGVLAQQEKLAAALKPSGLREAIGVTLPVNEIGFDQVTIAGQSVPLKAKFGLDLPGPINPDLSGKTVEFFVNGRSVGTATTDSDGVALLNYKPAAEGRYEVTYRIVDAGYKDAAGRATLHVEPDRPTLVFDIDGTLSNLADLKVPINGDKAPAFDGSPEVLRELAKNYNIVYLTARDEFLTGKTRDFLALHKFPQGAVLFNDFGIENADKRAQLNPKNHGKFKAEEIATLQARGLDIVAGIGNAPTDAAAYEIAGLPSFILSAGYNKRSRISYGKLNSDIPNSTVFGHYSELPGLLARAGQPRANSPERLAVLNAVHYGDDNDIRALTDAQLAAATPDEKAVFIRKLLDGFTGNDDERAALRILRSEARDVARFDRIINVVGMRNLVDDLHGNEGEEFRKLVNQVRGGSVRVGDWEGYQKYLDVVTETSTRAGGRITHLNGGKVAFPAMYKAIDEAKESVNWEMYEIHNDATGREMADHLIAAAKRGVTVNVLLDGVGNLIKQNKELVEDMRKNGVNVIVNEFPVTHLNIDHRKLLVVDGRTGFIGGMNTGVEYSSEKYSDQHSKVEGPAVADLQNAFFRRWTEEGGTIKDRARYYPKLEAVGNQSIRVVEHNPREDENIRNVYLRAIDTAAKSIRIQDPYFVDNEVFEHLKSAARRGVDVQIIVPDKGQFLTRAGARAYYKELLDAGVKIYEFKGVAHEKVAVIDSQWVTIGSSNLDSASLNLNHEMNVVMVDKKFAGEVEAAIIDDINNRSTRITKPVGGWFAQLGQKLIRKFERWI